MRVCTRVCVCVFIFPPTSPPSPKKPLPRSPVTSSLLTPKATSQPCPLNSQEHSGLSSPLESLSSSPYLDPILSCASSLNPSCSFSGYSWASFPLSASPLSLGALTQAFFPSQPALPEQRYGLGYHSWACDGHIVSPAWTFLPSPKCVCFQCFCLNILCNLKLSHLSWRSSVRSFRSSLHASLPRSPVSKPPPVLPCVKGTNRHPGTPARLLGNILDSLSSVTSLIRWSSELWVFQVHPLFCCSL